MPALSILIRSHALTISMLAFAVFIAGCSTTTKWNAVAKKPSAGSAVPGGTFKRGGGYYLDDGPGEDPPPDLHAIPDAIPRHEPLRPANMRPYVALGKWYTPKISHEPYRERGVASWYGRRYHGQRTATGEVYDMYAMTAAHPILPLPSYVRVTNMSNGKSVVLRVNDRGPFLSDRLIDLSYTAAYKLDVLDNGSALVEVESIFPDAPDLKFAEASVPNQTQGPAQQTQVPAQEGAGRPETAGQLSQVARPDLLEVLNLPVSAQDSALAVSDRGEGTSPKGIYLQLGAFSAYDNADSFLARMRAELPSLLDNVGIVAADGLFKVHAGPYPDQRLARQAADKIAQSLSIKPMLLTR